MNIIFKKYFLITIILFVAIYMVRAQQVEEIKKISKTFLVTNETSIEISNKYGLVHLNTWDKDSIKLDITMTIKAKQQYKIDKLKEGIDFEIVKTGHFIIARTIFQNSSRNMLMDITNTFLQGSDNSIAIDYNVFLPKNCNLDLDNKYGNIYIDDLDGNIKINLSYGNLKAYNLKGNIQIGLSFGDGNITSISNGIINSNYSDITISKAQKLNITSKSSTITIKEVDKIRLNSRMDKYFIHSIKTFDADASFSKITLFSIEQKAFSTINYGSIDFRSLGEKISSIDIRSKYAEITLSLVESPNIELEITHTRSQLKYPESEINLTKETVDPKLQKFRSFGIIGKKSESLPKINIISEGGTVNINR